ncbi:branched-chain amino acid aminotransferase [Ferrithrix thermotolerans DSM 19514]|uniref:Branched-chain amino acid aminotransferase n=1 Tax=Ferrithrix thermotolerans DSM 19514 TaxID=1121881 RepID=A0A1M4VGK5_9ACTN|nr:aminotransferase class IV [Ferrithrix thermotolerans]SHE68057.1 branched-chain amino acid aminotransferase [Ferrithrix thermotolerans DSM 19514]
MFAFVNGEVLDQREATISVFDHGLVTGDGVFETIAVYQGRPFALKRHLDRLSRSAKGLLLSPPDLDTVREATLSVVSKSDLRDGKVRITYTAGSSSLSSDRVDTKGTLVIACEPCSFGNGSKASVSVVPWKRNEHGALSGLKTTSYAENVLALSYAKERNAQEALFSNIANRLCEGTGSNVFVVWDDTVVTPPLSDGPLAGITRELVLEKIGGAEREIPMEVFSSSMISEVFLTSTIREVQAVVQIDGKPVGNGEIGPLTREFAKAFEELKQASSD